MNRLPVFYRVIFILPVSVIILLLISCNKDLSAIQSDVLSFNSVRLALYIDNAVWESCKRSTEQMLRGMGIDFRIINRDTIVMGKLDHYSVLLMPGANMTLYCQNLGSKGMRAIRNYVARGGGYIGICGGAYFAAETNVWRGWAGEPRIYYQYGDMLGLFKGTADGPIEDYAPSFHDDHCGIQMINQDHPITRNLPGSMAYVYDHGPMFIPEDGSSGIVLGRSVRGQKVILICCHYLNGRVFLTSGHPEFTGSAAVRQMVENAITWCSKLEN